MGDGLAIILAKGKKPPMRDVAKMRGGKMGEIGGAPEAEPEGDMDSMKMEMADHMMKAMSICMKMMKMKGGDSEEYGDEG